MQHPPCNCSSCYQGSSNTANIYIALLALCSVLGVLKVYKRHFFWTQGTYAAYQCVQRTVVEAWTLRDWPSPPPGSLHAWPFKSVMLSHVIRRPAGNHLLKARLWLWITKKNNTSWSGQVLVLTGLLLCVSHLHTCTHRKDSQWHGYTPSEAVVERHEPWAVSSISVKGLLHGDMKFWG